MITTNACNAEMLEKLMSGRARMKIFGHEVSTRLNPTNRARFEETKRRGFCVEKFANDPVGLCYDLWCEINKEPVVRLTPSRREAWCRVIMTPADWWLDLDADLRVRAILGYSLDCDFNGVTFRPKNEYSARVDRTQAGRIGENLVAIVRAARPWGLPLTHGGKAVESRRPVDWETLFPLWQSGVKGELVWRAIRVGYFVWRSVRDTGGFAYRDYCQVAARPLVWARISRGRADIEVRATCRAPLAVHQGTIPTLEAMVGHTGKFKDPYVWPASNERAICISRVPESIAESTLFRLYEMFRQPKIG